MFEIIPVISDAQIQDARILSQEYVTWMLETIQQTYPKVHVAAFADAHDYEDGGAKFPGDCVPPDGCLLLATDERGTGGCIALAKLDDTICEMRTLFVRPVFRGRGAGKLLVNAVLHEAQNIGYTTMRLDTLDFMKGALTLYVNLGFREIAPYRNVPADLAPYIHFLELTL